MAISIKTAVTALRVARMLPVVPLAIGAVALVGCAKVVTDMSKTRPLTTLAGSEWGLPDTEQFIAFKTESEVFGNGGCNNFFGSYTQEGAKLTFGPLASTKKACPGGLMQAETLFLKSIQSARWFEASHLAIVFMDDDGNTILRLQRRDWD
jgi:heat shock protein HslJ